jgi:hypothetical protein
LSWPINSGCGAPLFRFPPGDIPNQGPGILLFVLTPCAVLIPDRASCDSARVPNFGRRRPSRFHFIWEIC